MWNGYLVLLLNNAGQLCYRKSLNMGLCDVSHEHMQVVHLELEYQEVWLCSFHDLTLETNHLS